MTMANVPQAELAAQQWHDESVQAVADYVFVRPNGKPYRPRTDKLRARAWENQGGHDDDSCGVIVFGTLSVEEAQTFARESAAHWFGVGTVAEPVSGWWRDAIERGERRWVGDDIRGAPGVMFTWEPTYAGLALATTGSRSSTVNCGCPRRWSPSTRSAVNCGCPRRWSPTESGG
jgi:hypothetical protein